MGFFDSLKNWFSSEVAEVKDSASAAQSRLESEMDRREADLRASPQDKLDQIQSEISDDPFAAVRDKIEGHQAHAEAVEDLAAPALDEIVSDEIVSDEIVPDEIVPDEPV